MTMDPDSSDLTFIEGLLEEHAQVAGDIIEIGASTWAIHGSIAIDGDVIMAEYSSFEEAKTVLDHLTPNEPGLAHD